MIQPSEILHFPKGAEGISGIDTENSINMLQERYPQSVEDIVTYSQEKREVPLGYESIPPQNWLLSARSLDFSNLWWDHVNKTLPDIKNIYEEAKKRQEINHPGYRDYFVAPFEKMKTALAHILLETELAEGILKGQYAYILGEDSTGRIPTLLLKSTVDTLVVSSNQRKPEVRFYAGLRNPDWPKDSTKDSPEFIELKEKWEEGMGKFIGKLKTSLSLTPGGRILICTDVMGYGGSIRNIINVLEKYQIDFDIITFGNQDKKMNSFHGYRVFNGMMWQDDFNNNLRTNSVMSGVRKELGDVHARSAMVDIHDISKDDTGKDAREGLLRLMNSQDAMKLSRNLAKYIGANVAQAYLDYKAGKFELPSK